ncbi:fasciclin domain-containing protein [Spirosoma fluviale]|uniref:Uncaracterized surface protein containing fasciclin (FAS1) repeats n=1 Tax=Spirosoma fluviale TaxID=1597977 RepID=A0A286F6U5_9BACT|nr:fasciclin domain-containing protein [Spirosoma fluviale]SOD78594.1 Uncaracterized surface protein containing fasciclin (FAS1) repeats [Spirosoma fluviale]
MLANRNPFAGRKLSLLVALLVSLAVSFSACNEVDKNTPTFPTIGEIVNTGSRFTLLKEALIRAGLDGVVAQPGTYTVFAPTDDAFKAFGYVDAAAIKAAPVDLLKTVLQYHVLGARVAASDIPTAINTSQPTLAGLPLYISKVASGTGTASVVSINGARVLQADGQASNGVIHAIDRVLLPPVFGNVAVTIQSIPLLYPAASFKLLLAAVTKAGIGGALTGTGPLTVFAPTDAAFKAVGIDSTVIANTSSTALTGILTYHVLNSRTYSPLVTNGASLSTLQGGTITAGTSTTGITVSGKGNSGIASNITGPDITATNGVVHIIDRVLLPQ